MVFSGKLLGRFSGKKRRKSWIAKFHKRIDLKLQKLPEKES